MGPGEPPSQGGRRRGAPAGLVSLPLLCPGAWGALCLWTNIVCLGDDPLPQAQPLLSLYTVSSGAPLPPPPTTVLGVNR